MCRYAVLLVVLAALPAATARADDVPVTSPTTTTILADTPDPAPAGTAVTVTYAVEGEGAPTGDVTVSDGTDSCTGTVAAGQCTVTLTTSGARTLRATYAGDAGNAGSVSDGVPHMVNSPPVLTVLAGGRCTSTMGATVRLSVTDADGDPVSVSILPNPASPIASLALSGTGTDRTLTVTAHSAGGISFLLLASDGQSGSGQRAVTVRVGGNGGETINGGAGTDVIFGVNGTDTLNGNGGADYVCSGNGTGTTNGGDGNDTMDGQHGDDVLNGGDGDDFLIGGKGNDRFSGGLGTDTILDFSKGDTTDGT